MVNQDIIKSLEKDAKSLRKDILEMAIKHKDGHIAPSYSFVEIIVALYEQIMDKDDKFILSKGHGCLCLYAMLRKKGFNPKISGHPDIEPEQGIVCTTGSLGMGLGIGVGIAFAKKIKKKKGNVFVVVGDGECQEGQVWESLNLAQKYMLDNLIIIIDHNKLQALTFIKDVMNETNLKQKFEAFGAYTIEADGHNFNDLLESLDKKRIVEGKPKIIIAHTVKGKGLSFMENVACWHSRIPEGELLTKAHKELQ